MIVQYVVQHGVPGNVVTSTMTPKCGPSGEPGTTDLALVWLQPLMELHMRLHVILIAETLVTDWALIRLLVRMRTFVETDKRLRECLVANFAHFAFLTTMTSIYHLLLCDAGFVIFHCLISVFENIRQVISTSPLNRVVLFLHVMFAVGQP